MAGSNGDAASTAPSGPLGGERAVPASIMQDTARFHSTLASTTSVQNTTAEHELNDDSVKGKTRKDEGNLDDDYKEAPRQSPSAGLPSITHASDAPLDKHARELSKEIDDIFDSFDNFGPGRLDEEDGSNIFAELSNQACGSDMSASALHPSAEAPDSTLITAASPASSLDISVSRSKPNMDHGNSSDTDGGASPKRGTIYAAPRSITRRRNSSTPRRRHRPSGQMESISEHGSGNASSVESEQGGNDSALESGSEFVEDQRPQQSVSQHQASSDFSTSSTSPFSTPRRRIRASGESIGSGGANSSSTGSGSGNRGPSSRLRRSRRRLDRSNLSSDAQSNGERDGGDSERRRRIGRRSSSSNSIAASLDAGMATLRRWIRSRSLSLGSDASAGPGTRGSGQSVSSMTTMRLGEEDIFALSHTGSDPRRATTVASSTSGDPISSGFTYYRPFEVHVHHRELDAESGIYGSDDESGIRSSLLHPLVPSSVSSSLDESASQDRSRQRAHSEPDRVRVRDFFSTVYGARAIDGGDATDETAVDDRNSLEGRALHRAHHGPSLLTSPIIIEEEVDVVEQDIELTGQQPSTGLQMPSPLNGDGLLAASTPESSDALEPPSSPLSRNLIEVESELEPGGSDDGLDSIESDAEDGAEEGTPGASDPNRRARTRWIQINRRFRCIITSVAVLFSLLLFFIVIAWVLLASTYVLSHNKGCDVPLRGYFWLVSAQLMLDIFRADIMKWLCRWQTDSDRGIPPRVIMYNVAYLVYAMFVLRLGVNSVFIAPSTCSSTAPELFYASLVFVALSLMAWATIFLGYLIPFFFVAILLTRNGYFPNGEITSSRGRGRSARIGTGRIGDMVAEAFPSTYSIPAPSGCVDRLRVVLLHEFPDSYQRECCICMMEYKEGEVIVATPCEHVFHKRCCHEWLQLSRTCPVCRTDLPEALGMGEAAGSLAGSDHNLLANVRADEIRSNLMHYLRRERRQNEVSDRPEGTSVVPQGSDEPNNTERVVIRNNQTRLDV